jgi:serine/threonine protein kinase/tetratricopeptide (TPR) repeat protein
MAGQGQDSEFELPQQSGSFHELSPRFQLLQIREAFERAWKAESPPGIRPFLKGLRSPLLEQAVSALVEDDHLFRREHRQVQSPDDYVEELPEFSAIIRGFLHQTPEHAPTAVGDDQFLESAWSSGQMIGPYKLLQQLGHGGMGDVWMAEQRAPVRRRVALKLIRVDRIGKKFISRFEAERQALALMDHQNIAKVLDAGTTQSGQPYFAMELIHGRPITDYCDENKLNVKARLALFMQACQAIQHAHQKGIIHRDIKPSNILVMQSDRNPQVKVIDFGLAKAFQASQQLTDKTLFTEFGQVLGTYQYMSPEQAEMNSLDVDTRSDVYSLGVLLYELLTGTTPLERQRIHELAFDRLMAVIREEEAPRPSRRLSSSGDSVSGISEHRQTDPRRLGAILKGDLDWIAMKALEKDRTRRYDSPIQMAEDVQRFLSSEAILARPPSAAYRLRKMVRKHRGAVITGVAFVILLIAGLVGTGFMWWKAERLAEDNSRLAANEGRARQIADQRTRDARVSAQLAEESATLARTNEEKALREQRIAESVREFLQDSLLRQASVYEQALSMSQPGNNGSARHDITVRELLDRAAAEFSPDVIADKFPGEPDVQCEILATISQAYQACDEHDIAVEYATAVREIRDQTRGRNDPETLAATVDLMFTCIAASRHPEAIDEMLRIVSTLESVLTAELSVPAGSGAGTTDDQQSGERTATPAVEAVIRAIERRVDPRRFILPRASGDVSDLFSAGWKIMVALPQLNRLFELAQELYGPEHHYTIFAQGITAVAYQALQQNEKAAEIYEDVLRKTAGRDDFDEMLLAGVRRILAVAYEDLQIKPRETLALIQEFHDVMERRAGPEHPLTLMSLLQLADARESVGDADGSLALYERVLQLQERQLGATHLHTMETRWDIGIGHLNADRFEQAIPVLQRHLEIERAQLGVDATDTLLTQYRLAQACHGAGDFEAAISLLENELELERAKVGADPENVSFTMHELAVVYRDDGQLERARELFEETLERRLVNPGPAHQDTLLTINTLARLYQQSDRPDAAISILEDALKNVDNRQLTAGCRSTLRSIYLEAGRVLALKDSVMDELAAVRDQTEADSLERAAALVAFGIELIELGAPSLAEPLIEEGLRIRERELPQDWLRYNAESLLGAVYTEQRRLNEAETLLLSGYHGIRETRKSIPARLRVIRQLEAVDRLVQFYESRADDRAVQRWRKQKSVIEAEPAGKTE